MCDVPMQPPSSYVSLEKKGEESGSTPPIDTGAAVVPPPSTSVTSGLGYIQAPEGLILEHVKPETIFEGTSRLDEVKLDFDRTGYDEDSAQKLLQQKHSELLKKGYTTLIGKIAQRIDEEISKGLSTASQVEKSGTLGAAQITFMPNSGKTTDIKTGTQKYEQIIQDMYTAGECSPRTAFFILENLSKGHRGRRDYELFLNLPEHAKNLMAVLICEAIRFQEDGALERMAIRKVLSLFSELSTPSVSTTSATASSSGATESPVATNYSDIQSLRSLEDNPFYKIFVSDIYSEDSPLAIFAATQDAKKVGGKRRQLDLIEGKSSEKNSHYKFDQAKFFNTADCLSDSEEQSTGNPSTPVRHKRTTSSGRPVITPKKLKETPSPKKTRSRVSAQKAGKGKNKK